MGARVRLGAATAASSKWSETVAAMKTRNNVDAEGTATDLRETTVYALWQAEHAMRLAVDAALADLGISLPQYGALMWLLREPGLSTADLARLNQVSPQNMGMAVTRLMSLGYIERTPPTKGRVVALRLSDRGRETLERAIGRVEGVQRRLHAGLSEQERAALPRMLVRLRQNAAGNTGANSNGHGDAAELPAAADD